MHANDFALQKKISWEGVTCEHCHSMRDVSFKGADPAATVTLTVVKSGPMKDTVPSPHGTVFSPVHTSSASIAVSVRRMICSTVCGCAPPISGFEPAAYKP